MRDPKLDKWAELLVDYSLEGKKGEHAMLVGELEALPLLEACYEAFILRGISVETVFFPKAWQEFLVKHGSDELLSKTPPVSLFSVQHCDLYLAVMADSNTHLLAQADRRRQSLLTKARNPISATIMERAAKGEMRWVLTQYPTPASAQEAGMGSRSYEEYILSLGALEQEDPIAYWRELERRQAGYIKFLEMKRELRFQNASGTDLHVNIEGMRWVNCCGKINFPDGEIYTGPNLNVPDGGVNGRVCGSLPTLFRNQRAEGIALTFENGKVIEATADVGEDYLHAMLDLDEGARRVGEVAIGTNNAVIYPTKSILYDEKMGGTFHIALGRGYPQTGNTNASALHWDMIFDLRNGGTIHADGELFYRDGEWLIDQ